MQEFPKKRPLPIKFISILDNIWRTMVAKGQLNNEKPKNVVKQKLLNLMVS